MDVSITDFGAVAGSDVTTRLQQAVNAVGQAGGGRVRIPSGRWLLDNEGSVWVQYSSVTIEGEGPGSVIEIVNWQPFIADATEPPQLGHGTILVGHDQNDVSGFTLRRLRFISEWDVDNPAPQGPMLDSKGHLVLGWADQDAVVRETLIEEVSTFRCGSYFATVTGRHDGLEFRKCSARDQYASAFACVGAVFSRTPRIIACRASRISGFGAQWTNWAEIDGFYAYDCRAGGIMMINNDDNSGWTTITGGRFERCGNQDSDVVAGAGIYVGGEIYGGRRVIVSEAEIIDSYGSGIAWGGGNLKEIVVERCKIIGFGLGCGTDDPGRAGIGKACGIQPTAGVSLAGYSILLRDNTIYGRHTGYTAGSVCCRNGIWLAGTESDGNTLRATMLGWSDAAKDVIGGTYGEGDIQAAGFPSNASDFAEYG